MLRNTLNTFMTATLIMLLGVSSSAQAIVPMGDLMGTTSVTFGDGKPVETSSTPLSVPLIPKAPDITLDARHSAGIAQWTPDDTTSREIIYQITSTANGPDSYRLATKYVTGDIPSNIKGSPQVDAAPNSIVLGVTAAIDITGDTIKVPFDNNSDDENSINGIEVGDTVVIRDSPYQVLGLSNNAENSFIKLDKAPGDGVVRLGTPIAERKAYTVTVTDVFLENAEAAGQVFVKVTASADLITFAPSLTTSLDSTFNVLTPIGPSYAKYVRNNNDNLNPKGGMELWVEQGFAYEYPPDSETFYFRSQLNEDDPREPKENSDTQVEVVDGNLVEFLIVLRAGNQEGEAGFTISDTLSPFVTYIPDSPIIIVETEDGGIYEDDVFNSGFGELELSQGPQGPTLAFTTDTGGISASELTIAKNKSAYFRYQVRVGGLEARQSQIARVTADRRLAGDPTYLGCVDIQSETPSSQLECLPDGTSWERVAGSFGVEGDGRYYTACWRLDGGGRWLGSWVVGPNSLTTTKTSAYTLDQKINQPTGGLIWGHDLGCWTEVFEWQGVVNEPGACSGDIVLEWIDGGVIALLSDRDGEVTNLMCP